MPLYLRMCRRIKGAHSDSGPILKNRVPKQGRSARPSKTATNLLRGLIPFHIFLTRNCECRTCNIYRDLIMSRLLAACCAVTGVERRQVARHGECDLSAKTAAVMFHLWPLRRQWQRGLVAHCRRPARQQWTLRRYGPRVGLAKCTPPRRPLRRCERPG